ncbi:MAG TPA: hypothetical protein VK592_09795 [Candidatus Dormibacteraeota bacterium]|nr:hypothetical protein [Candidatus Dormibacteraeota bacterium]
MARAKRTDRAEARRRYRASQAPAEATSEELSEAGAAPAASGSAASATVPKRGVGRASLFATLDIHAPDFRGDVAALPQIARTTPLLWLAFGLGLLSIILAGVMPLTGDATNPAPGDAVTSLAVQFLIQFPTTSLLGGFAAPRAAYLFGIGLGMLQGIALTLLLVRVYAITGQQAAPELIASNGLFLVLQGMIFAALASWYRRWLRSMSARNAAARAEREKRQRREAKRPAGGTRPAR